MSRWPVIGGAYERRGSAGRRVSPRGGGLSPQLRAINALSAIPNTVAFFDSSYRVTEDVSHNVTAVTMRVGGALTPSVSAPVVGSVVSPTGKRGVTFTLASNQYLIQAASSIATAIAEADYSALTLVRTAAGATVRANWAAGDNDGAAQVANVITGAEQLRHTRATSGGAATNSNGATVLSTSAPSLITETYDATGNLYNSWLNGTAEVAASANARDATGADTFIIGASWSSGAITLPSDATVWCVLIALGIWTTAQRQAYEAAARTLWGTP